MSYKIKIISTLHDIDADEWNKLVDDDFPFLRHEFLIALEDHNAVGETFGWLPHFFLACKDNELIAAVPAYIKYNSYGEFVFDWAWASAWERSGLTYYPKLVTAAPYTPAVGPRLLLKQQQDSKEITDRLMQAITDDCKQNHFSSYHCLFTNDNDTRYFQQHPDFMLRLGCQFHWQNQDYTSFDDFLQQFTSKKRKQIKRERRLVREQEVEFELLDGHTANDQHWDIYHHFYEITFERKSGIPTLSKSFFKEIARTMPDNILLVMAKHQGEYVASAFNIKGTKTLYGRHWGCFEYFDQLHFEACYYQGLEYCIENGLKYFQPGAQGEHKIARGFLPTKTWSAHWIANPEFKIAIEQFVQHEQQGMLEYIQQLNQHSPYKK